MDTRPIGVFDSGLGGLTAVRELRQLLPSENIIYFGDTARVPYGGRSAEILLKYARQDVRFLRSHDIKAILVACGTVSTTALPQLRLTVIPLAVFSSAGTETFHIPAAFRYTVSPSCVADGSNRLSISSQYPSFW